MITRFAPSPSGPLHLGHAWSAMVAADMGDMRLRMDNMDQARCTPEWAVAAQFDLKWLGIEWTPPILFQTGRARSYGAALDQLWAEGMLYPCACRRGDIRAAWRAPQEGAPLLGPDGVIYPGTCREVSRRGPRPRDEALRLDARAVGDLTWIEKGEPQSMTGETFRATIGDVVLARRDMGSSYHLSVVLDDVHQGVDLVTRGDDLMEATPIHVALQGLLGLPSPLYHHHDLVRDADGKRLAKRDDARSIRMYREEGWSPAALRDHLRHSRTAPGDLET